MWFALSEDRFLFVFWSSWKLRLNPDLNASFRSCLALWGSFFCCFCFREVAEFANCSVSLECFYLWLPVNPPCLRLFWTVVVFLSRWLRFCCRFFHGDSRKWLIWTQVKLFTWDTLKFNFSVSDNLFSFVYKDLFQNGHWDKSAVCLSDRVFVHVGVKTHLWPFNLWI